MNKAVCLGSGEPEPSSKARVKAFSILRSHPECLRDNAVMNELIDDIARAIAANED